ncbi:TIGR03943 family putative permease subunit [Scatolibacter rhodanostii]|uniref:TIGR03943 family putative permease subunit n=1 Tax=Scatolibacter rhodanostii TaxID=2014781 RepID=UPI001FA90B85|nr:TIGR03943 family protein [Scatolibacter rhodanostii]
MVKSKKINAQICLEMVCYFLFSGTVIWFLASGKYLSYITPKMMPYLIFSVVVMGFWIALSFWRLMRPQYKVRAMHCLVILIPTLLMISLPQTTVDGGNLSGDFATANTMGGVSRPLDSGTLGISPSERAEIDEMPGLDKENKTITVSDKDFSMWMTEIYNRMDEFKGYTVTMTGYVFTDSELLEDNEFVPARLMMSCCIADLVPTGMRATYEKAAALEEGSWVTVEAILDIKEGEGYREPKLLVNKVTPTEPVEGYIYPSY